MILTGAIYRPSILNGFGSDPDLLLDDVVDALAVGCR